MDLKVFQSATELADALIASVGNTIVLGLPIGIGKAVHIADALFERAMTDPNISLTIFTGLTLSPPAAGSGLQGRFAAPLLKRLYGNWPTPAYVRAIENDSLPSNISIREFYLRPGAYLRNISAQQNYTSVNYSHVVEELLALGVNVIAQLVAVSDESPDNYSLSSNPEITLDLLPRLESRRRLGQGIAIVGQVNRNLPYMFGDAELDAGHFDFILDSSACQFPLFGMLNRRVVPADYAAGMHVASLVRDGGTLQLGIGSLSDAVAHCLRLRQESPEVFCKVLKRLPGGTRSPRRASLAVETGPFSEGLYASTEMLSDAVLALFELGLLRRAADDRDKTLIHGGFFIGSNAFYKTLAEMPRERRQLINMTRISFVNTLFGDEKRKRGQRRHARFINETMMVTLLGAAISDTLEDGRVVSGVGGQFDFVSMAHSIPDAHSILMLRASRRNRGTLESTIRWSYANATVPRHHRDVFVTEYGIAATRGMTDRQVIEAMLGIADSSFQSQLIAQAIRAHKLPSNYRLPIDTANNTQRSLQDIFDDPDVRAFFPDYPLGTDLTDTERLLVPALEWLQANTSRTPQKLRVVLAALVSRRIPENSVALKRLGLDRASGLSDRLQRRLVNYALHKTGG